MWVGIQRSEERREYDRRHDYERLNKILGQNMTTIQAKNECLQNTEIIWNLLSHMFSCQRSQICMNTKQRQQRMKEEKNERDRNVRHHRKHLCVDSITITMDLMTQVLWHTLSRHTIAYDEWACGVSARDPTYVIISIFSVHFIQRI